MPDRSVPDTDNRVVSIRSSRKFREVRATPSPPPGDLTQFERSDEPDDFRHRMVTNAIVFVFVSLLVLGALWLANSLAIMRKNQDCVLSGKRGCTPVEAPISTR